MNELATKWIAALRSGLYQQGRGQLAKDGKFCCLGVACEVYRAEHNGFEYNAKDPVLPEVAADALGLRYCHGASGDGQHRPLWKMNDEEGRSFVELATHIEKNWEVLSCKAT